MDAMGQEERETTCTSAFNPILVLTTRGFMPWFSLTACRLQATVLVPYTTPGILYSCPQTTSSVWARETGSELC